MNSVNSMEFPELLFLGLLWLTGQVVTEEDSHDETTEEEGLYGLELCYGISKNKIWKISLYIR